MQASETPAGARRVAKELREQAVEVRRDAKELRRVSARYTAKKPFFRPVLS